jgi:branched-chain amino acid transport system substrate-binding protein
MTKWSTRTLSVLGATALVVSACGGGGAALAKGGGNTASAPGVTSKTVTVGVIWSGTGVASSEYTDYAKGIQARFAYQNAHGGVFGRKLSADVVDDQSNPNQTKTGVQDLVSKGVFGMIGATPFLFEAAPYMQQQGLPVVSGAYDGPEWGQRPYTNMFSTTGNISPNLLVNATNTGVANFFKAEGATVVAGLGYSISPSSADAAKAVGITAKYAHLKVGYINDSIPFGSVNVEPIVLAMKSAHVNAVAMEMDDNTNFAILTAAKQSGLHLKVPISATGYGQPLLNDKSALAAAQGSFFISEGPPLSTAPEKAFRAALSRFAGFSGVPGFDWYEGWTNADLFVKGMEVAGRNPTRASFIANLHKVTGYNAGGLLPAAIDLSLAHFGQAAKKACGWYATVKGDKFVPVPADGRPTCGVRVSG